MGVTLRLVTVALDPSTGRFPETPLASLPGSVESVGEYFFLHAGLPHLLLVVHTREATTAAPREPVTKDHRDNGVRASLDPIDREVFDRVRAWRNARAAADNVPPYVLLTNRNVADLARARPADRKGFEAIAGLGEGRWQRFGEELLTVVAGAGA